MVAGVFPKAWWRSLGGTVGYSCGLFPPQSGSVFCLCVCGYPSCLLYLIYDQRSQFGLSFVFSLIKNH